VFNVCNFFYVSFKSSRELIRLPINLTWFVLHFFLSFHLSSGVQQHSAITKTSHVQSENPFQYNSSDHYRYVRSCSVQLLDIIDYNDTEQHCIISECGSLKCMTCKMLIIDAYFTSNLTKMSYNTRSYDDLTCRLTNVVYGLECHHDDLVNRYGISVSQMTTDMFHLS
jgi:hypothetical protein